MSLKLPKIISFVNNKGGCGKTSTAVNSLGYFSEKKVSLVLVDCDLQRSAARTAEKMGIPYEEIFDAAKLIDALPALSEKYELVIIDGPANSSELNREIISESQLVIIPSRATTYDVESAANTIKFVEKSQRVNLYPPVGVVFLNAVTPNTLSLRQSREHFAQSQKIVLLEEAIPHRQCIGDIGLENKTVYQMTSRSATEVAAKYSRLFTQAIDVYNSAQN